MPPNTPCSPTPFDAPALPNDMIFGPAGHAYITDSLQATIWRVTAGGGTPEIWFQDVRLATTSFGVNGLRLSPDRSTMYLTVTQDLDNRAFVYALPFEPNPSSADLEVFHEYTGGDLPDGLAFGESGLPLRGHRHAVRLRDLDPRRERKRGGPPGDPEGSPIFPYDSPANIAFDGRGSILVSNHAFVTGVTNHEQFIVLQVWVDDEGDPLELPRFR